MGRALLPSSGRVRRRTHASERGQSLVELALSAPILILLLLGVAELGHGINSKMTVIAAARDGARLGAQGAADDAAIRSLVGLETARLAEEVPSACNGDEAGVCIDRSTLDSAPRIKVKVCYEHGFLLGIPGMGRSMTICSATSMRVVS